MTKPFKVLGIIPARGGSKSVPKKNLALLAGASLLSYVIKSALSSDSIARVICSTDCDLVAEEAELHGAEVVRRPRNLAQDESPVSLAIRHVLDCLAKESQKLPDAVALLQPTSPFVLPRHIDACTQALQKDQSIASVQTVASLPHNHHAYNQRQVVNNRVTFRFQDERKACYNKQSKPALYKFGNLVITRTSNFLVGGEVFCDPSAPILIKADYALDVDQAEDISLAEWLLQSGRVDLTLS